MQRGGVPGRLIRLAAEQPAEQAQLAHRGQQWPVDPVPGLPGQGHQVQPGGLADLPGVLLLGGGQLELGHGQTPSGMIGQSEAAKSSLEDITIVTKAQYNETAAAA